MDIVTDYANWKFENYTLLDTLVKKKSNIIRRFPHVILVADYYYDKVANKNENLNRDEEIIFSTAFNYLHDHFNTIDLILEKVFNKNIEAMDKISKTINLLIYTNDFQSELENTDPNNLSAKKKLDDFEARVYKYIEARLEAPDEMFALLSDITTSIFDNYYSVNEIMYDIAVQLGIEPDEDDTDDYTFIY